MQTRAARADRPAIDLRRLVAGFLRMAPDVAIVGEVRDREALPEQLRSPLFVRRDPENADECRRDRACSPLTATGSSPMPVEAAHEQR
ncbi:unannotated protein [freshwater metagenome]